QLVGILKRRGFSLSLKLMKLLAQDLLLGSESLTLGQFFRRSKFKDGLVGSEPAFLTLVAREFVNVVKERVELVKLTLRNRIELVVMAASTTQGQSQKDGASRVYAVHHCFHAILLKVDAA